MSTIESTKPGAFISLSAAADILGISVHTLRRRIAAGELPAFRTGQRIIRVRVNRSRKASPPSSVNGSDGRNGVSWVDPRQEPTTIYS